MICLARSDPTGSPVGETVPDIDVVVAEQPVDLLDRVLGHQSPRLRQRLPDHGNRQRRAGHHAQRRPGQRIHSLGVKVMLIQIINERANVLQTPTKSTIRFLHVTLKSAPARCAVEKCAVFTLDLVP